MRRCLVLIVVMMIPYVACASETRSGRIAADERWTLANSPYLISSSLMIPAGVSVTIEAGVEVRLAAGVILTVDGRLDADGTEQEIRFVAAGLGRWGVITYEREGAGVLRGCYLERGSSGGDGRTGMVTAYRCNGVVEVDRCRFENWSNTATETYYSPNMTIRNCHFGPGTNEAVHGTGSAVLVEYNTFEPRFGYNDAIDLTDNHRPDPVPLVRWNTFLGSEDDAIDLDDCDAYVDGNIVMNCRGGEHDPIGISGDRTSQPTLVNNLILHCESGIGFKNGARITVINNTILSCDRGIWLHQNPTQGVVWNTLIWGEEGQQSIRLEPGSTIEVFYSRLRGDTLYPGEGNQNEFPLLGDDYAPLPGSPLIDAGYGFEMVPDHDLYQHTRLDVAGAPNQGAGNPSYVDIGAIEYVPPVGGVMNWLDNEM